MGHSAVKLKDATKNLTSIVGNLAQQTENELNKLNKIIERQGRIIGGIIRILGIEEVQKSVDEMQAEMEAKMLEQQKTKVAHLVSKGILVPAEAITGADNLVVGTDTLADGSLHRVQFEMAGIEEEFRPLYLGKKVGEVIEGNGAKLTVSEIYSVDYKKLEESAKQEQSVPQAPAAA